MRNFKGILAVLIAVVVLSPIGSYGSGPPGISFSIHTNQGTFFPLLTGTCAAGNASCTPAPGNYGGAILGGIGSGPLISASDTAITDILKFTNFTISTNPAITGVTAGDITLTYSQNFILGQAGTFSYGDYMGGYFTPPGTLKPGDSVTMNGTVEPTANPSADFSQLLYQVGPSNGFSRQSAIPNILCSFAGDCFENISQSVLIHFTGTVDSITVTNSFDGEVHCLSIADCVADPGFITADNLTRSNLDCTAFLAAGGTDCSQFGNVPEPATVLLLGTGLGGIFLLGRKRLRRA